MLDFNIELLDGLINGLEVLSEFACIDPTFKIKLKNISPVVFSKVETDSIEEWYSSLASELFISTIKDENIHAYHDGEEVMEILKEADENLFDSFYDTACDLLSDYDTVRLLEISTDEDEEDFFKTYFGNLGLQCISFATDLALKGSDVYSDFSCYVPRLIQDEFELREEFLLNSKYNPDTSRMEILYVAIGGSEFAEHIDAHLMHRKFLELLKFNICAKGREV